MRRILTCLAVVGPAVFAFPAAVQASRWQASLDAVAAAPQFHAQVVISGGLLGDRHVTIDQITARGQRIVQRQHGKALREMILHWVQPPHSSAPSQVTDLWWTEPGIDTCFHHSIIGRPWYPDVDPYALFATPHDMSYDLRPPIRHIAWRREGRWGIARLRRHMSDGLVRGTVRLDLHSLLPASIVTDSRRAHQVTRLSYRALASVDAPSSVCANR